MSVSNQNTGSTWSSKEAWKASNASATHGRDYILISNKTVSKMLGRGLSSDSGALGYYSGNAVVKDSIIKQFRYDLPVGSGPKFKGQLLQNSFSAIPSNETSRRRFLLLTNSINHDGREGSKKSIFKTWNLQGEVYGVEVSLHQYLTYTTEKAW